MLSLSRRALSRYAYNKQVFLHPLKSRVVASLSERADATPLGTVNTASPTVISPHNFAADSRFLEVLHRTIADTVHNDFLFIMEAGVNANAYMPIYDFRHTPSYARIPEVDNIFGYVRVDANGKMIPHSYEANALYRLCNGESGLIKLSDHLHEKVKEACENRH